MLFWCFCCGRPVEWDMEVNAPGCGVWGNFGRDILSPVQGDILSARAVALHAGQSSLDFTQPAAGTLPQQYFSFTEYGG